MWLIPRYVTFPAEAANNDKLGKELREIRDSSALSNPSRSKRPYLIRAMHEWMGDNSHTPHIVVDAAVDGVSVPKEHVKDGKIILNISETAAHNLKLTNDAVSFRARFSGVPFDVWVPMKSVLGIYARETGQGMIFSHDADTTEQKVGESDADIETTRSRPHLKVVK
jgi:stringent starvation protein B